MARYGVVQHIRETRKKTSQLEYVNIRSNLFERICVTFPSPSNVIYPVADPGRCSAFHLVFAYVISCAVALCFGLHGIVLPSSFEADLACPSSS